MKPTLPQTTNALQRIISFALLLLLVAIVYGIIHCYACFSNAQVSAKTGRAESEMKAWSETLATIHYQQHRYPASPDNHRLTLTKVLNTLFLDSPDIYTGMQTEPLDPFSRTPYLYYTDEKTWYLFASIGPDGYIDLTESVMTSIPNPTISELSSHRYQPSNGLRSKGDIFLIGP